MGANRGARKVSGSVSSTRISRCPSERQPSPLLTANSTEFEITVLAADEKWTAAELKEIRAILESSSDDLAAASAIRRLGYLNTPDSTRELARRFVASNTESNQGLLAQLLVESSWRDISISELEGSLRTEKAVPERIYRVLAMLLAAREFQERPLPDSDEFGERRRAIEMRGHRLNAILSELRLSRAAR